MLTYWYFPIHSIAIFYLETARFHLLQERCEPGVCKVARYHGPLVLELKPDIPGVARTSAERFTLEPACPAFQAAWHTRSSTGDIDLLAADGSSQRVHRLVLQCRLPVLGGAPLQPSSSQVRYGYSSDPKQEARLLVFAFTHGRDKAKPCTNIPRADCMYVLVCCRSDCRWCQMAAAC
jgi:hypothetical protein